MAAPQPIAHPQPSSEGCENKPDKACPTPQHGSRIYWHRICSTRAVCGMPHRTRGIRRLSTRTICSRQGGHYAKVSASPLGAGLRGPVRRCRAPGAGRGVCTDCTAGATGGSHRAPARSGAYLDERIPSLGWAGVYLAAWALDASTAPACELGRRLLAADPAWLDVGAGPLARLIRMAGSLQGASALDQTQ